MKEKFNTSLKLLLVVTVIAHISILFYGLNLSSNSLAGLYFRNKEIIIVEAENNSISFIQEVFYHELGHHIWYIILNETERENYSFLINETDEEKIEEDFASWFSVYLYGQSGEKEKYDFFEKMIDKYNLDLYRRTRR